MQEQFSSTPSHHDDKSILGHGTMSTGQWGSEDNCFWVCSEVTIPSASTPWVIIPTESILACSASLSSHPYSWSPSWVSSCATLVLFVYQITGPSEQISWITTIPRLDYLLPGLISATEASECYCCLLDSQTPKFLMRPLTEFNPLSFCCLECKGKLWIWFLLHQKALHHIYRPLFKATHLMLKGTIAYWGNERET